MLCVCVDKNRCWLLLRKSFRILWILSLAYNRRIEHVHCSITRYECERVWFWCVAISHLKFKWHLIDEVPRKHECIYIYGNWCLELGNLKRKMFAFLEDVSHFSPSLPFWWGDSTKSNGKNASFQSWIVQNYSCLTADHFWLFILSA